MAPPVSWFTMKREKFSQPDISPSLLTMGLPKLLCGSMTTCLFLPRGQYLFITKFNSTGNLQFSTYFGGSEGDNGKGLGVDSAGNIYISGITSSKDFPLKNAIKSNFGIYNFNTLFVSKFNSTGSLMFSTYFGGSTLDSNTDLALDNQGNIFITGYTISSDFPMLNAYNATYSGHTDSFISKFNSTGSLLFSTYFSLNVGVISYAITTDEGGDCYIAGAASTSNYITTNAFIAKFNSSGSLLFKTLLGGSQSDAANAIVVDKDGNSFIVGDSFSTNFPLKNAYNAKYGGTVNAFVAEFDSNGNLTLDTLIGGSLTDAGFGVGLDNSNNIYVMGYTVSEDFPLKYAYQNTFPGGISGFLTKLSIQQVAIPSSSTSNLSSTISKTHASPGFTLFSLIIVPIFVIFSKRGYKKQ